MADRPLHDGARVAASALDEMNGFHSDVLKQVTSAIEKDDVVVVGMAQNPHVKNVRKALDEASVKYTYLKFGSYFSKWKERLAIKMWSGWPTFPQVFVKGEFLGGEDLTKAAIADGSLKKKLG